MVRLPKDCVAEAVANGMDRERATAIRDHITNSPREQWGNRSKDLKDRAKKEAESAERRAGIALHRRVTAQQQIKAAEEAGFDMVTGLQSLLVGSNRPFKGSRNSAENAILGFKSMFFNGFRKDLGDNQRLFASKQVEEDWVQELAELNDKNGQGQPGITKNPEALKIAEAIKRFQDNTRDTQNKLGAEIGTLNRYVARTVHDPELLERMGREEWKKLVYNTADIARTFGPDRSKQEIEDALDEMYRKLKSGDFSDLEAPEDAFVPASQNIAKKVSESRFIQFGSAKQWYQYMQKAYSGSVTELVLTDGLRAARNAGMMATLGPNPADNFARIMTMMKRREDLTPAQRTQLEGAEGQLDAWLKMLMGRAESQKISNKGAALFGQNVMKLQRVAKLGFLPFSQLADLGVAMSELRYQGLDFGERILGPMGGYFKGKGSQQREVARLVGGAIEGWIAEVNNRMDVAAHLDVTDREIRGGDWITGALSKTQNWMFRWTGAEAMTNRAREMSTYLMATHWGKHRGVEWAALNEAERRIMSAFDLGPAEWKALNAAEWSNVEGSIFLTPSVVQDIPTEALTAWRASNNRVNMTDDAAREEIATKLWRYYADRERYAVLNPGIQEQYYLTFGGNARPDQTLGIAFRLSGQFKSYVLGSIVRLWGREIYGGQGGYGAVSGLVQFAGAAIILGTVAEMLRDIAKNTDPFEKFNHDPVAYLKAGAVRGGAVGVLGDFLLNEYSRHGQRLGDYIAGPTIGGTLQESLAAFSQAQAGKDPTPTLINLAKTNLPLQNVWFAKSALDYLIWHRLMNYANPGYTSRIRRRRRREGMKPIIGN